MTSSVKSEHVYTHGGYQRPVFVEEGAPARFALELMPGDSARVEVSYARRDDILRGHGDWEVFEGGSAGAVYGATALRVRLEKLSGWATLVVGN